MSVTADLDFNSARQRVTWTRRLYANGVCLSSEFAAADRGGGDWCSRTPRDKLGHLPPPPLPAGMWEGRKDICPRYCATTPVSFRPVKPGSDISVSRHRALTPRRSGVVDGGPTLRRHCFSYCVLAGSLVNPCVSGTV